MSAIRQISVVLASDLAEAVERKVETAAFASASEVLSGGVRALLDRASAEERWLREEVVPGHAEYVADPSSAIAAEDRLDRLKARWAADPMKRG